MQRRALATSFRGALAVAVATDEQAKLACGTQLVKRHLAIYYCANRNSADLTAGAG